MPMQCSQHRERDARTIATHSATSGSLTSQWMLDALSMDTATVDGHDVTPDAGTMTGRNYTYLLTYTN